MSSAIRTAAKFLHHCRTAGAGDARRRLKEERETGRIRAERERWPELTAEERRAQEGAAVSGCLETGFEIIPLAKGAAEAERETLLRSLREQTYRRYRMGGAETEGKEGENKEGDYLLFVEEDGWLHPAALYETAKAIRESGAELLYADEDYSDGPPKGPNRPWHKPGYGPDTLRGCDMTGGFLACSRRVVKEAGAERYAEMTAEERWDAAVRMAAAASATAAPGATAASAATAAGAAAAAAAGKVLRIPKVLFCRRPAAGGGVPEPAVRRETAPVEGEPLVSILIPNRDHREDLARCVDSIREKTTWPRWEIIIIENNSREEETFRCYRELEQDGRIRVIRRDGAFNYSAVNNEGFRAAKGEQILLLNNDTEVIAPDWIQEMLRYAQRENTGAVGAKLLYPDGTIQHAGIGIGIEIAAGHYFRGFAGDSGGYFGRLRYAQDVSAATAACLMIPRHVYEEMGGLDESYSLVFNDVDLCLRIREAGYLIVWTPWAELTHYESKSRGPEEETEEKKRFFVRETNRFLRRWCRVLEEGDPYYNPNLTREKGDFSPR